MNASRFLSAVAAMEALIVEESIDLLDQQVRHLTNNPGPLPGGEVARVVAIADAARARMREKHVRLVEAKERPSTLGEYFLYVFLPQEVRAAMIGDLVEEFAEVAKKFGARKAHWWFWKQVLTSIGPVARLRLRDIALVGLLLDRGSELVQFLRDTISAISE